MSSMQMQIGLPEKIGFNDHGTYIEIVRTWLLGKVILFTAIAVFLDVFLFFWYSAQTADGTSISFPFLLFQVGVGVGFTYYALTGWLNRTHIMVSPATSNISTS